MQKLKRGITLFLAVLMIVASLPLSAFAAVVEVESDVVLYEAYGGGGNSGAYYKNDYIVLKNTGKEAVSLDGLVVEAYSAKGSTPYPNGTIPLTGSLEPGAYYLIQGGQGNGGEADLPAPNQKVDVAMGGKGFKIYLKDSSGKILDMLGAGDANDFLGTGAAPAPNNQYAVIRKDVNGDGIFDKKDITGDNAEDWEPVLANKGHLDYLLAGSEPGTPDPGTPDPGENPETPPEEVLSIAEARKAALGEKVTVEGIVTFSHADGNVFIQDDTAGIGVFKVTPQVAPGTKVRVTGTRGEYGDQVQINKEKIKNLGAGTLPSPQEITLADVGKDEYNAEYVVVKDVTLGKIGDFSTPVTKDGVSVDLYKMPAGDYKEGDTVTVTGVAGIHKGKAQIRVQSPADITVTEQGEGPAPVPDLPKVEHDPLTDEKIAEIKAQYPGALTIPEVQEIYKNKNISSDKDAQPVMIQEDAMVIGVATYAFDGGSSLIIEDVVDGQVYGFQIYGPTENVLPGEIIVARGNLVSFYGLPEMSNVSAMKLVETVEPIEPQVLTLGQIDKYREDLVNEYVYIKDVTLPDPADKYPKFTDATGTLDTYRMPEYPIGTQKGDVVDIKGAISPHNGNTQIRLNDSSDYIIANDTVKPHVVLGNLIEARAGVDYEIAVDVVDNVGATSVVMTYDGKEIPLRRDEKTGKWTGSIPGDDLAGKDSLVLSFTAKDKAGNTSEGLYRAPFKYGESQSIGDTVTLKVDNRPQIIMPKPENLSATGEDKRPEISVGIKNISQAATATLSLNGGEEKPMTLKGDRFTYTPDADLADGKISATVSVKDGEKSNAMTWEFFIGKSLVNHYRGQLHSHSNYSDGAGTPEQAVDYASKAENIDFFALTDHSNYFDEAGNLGTFDNENSGLKAPDGSGMSKWKRYKEIIESKKTDDFLPLYGFEMTWTKSGANYGHINTYNTNGFVSRNNAELNDKNNSKGLLRYYDLLKNLDDNTFSEFNHPGDTFGTFDDFAHYDPATNQNIKLIEIGNGEGPIHGSGYFPSYDQYWKALDQGWKLAPSINQDNHKGKWGDANDGRNVVIAENLEKDDIIQAIRNLHVYASEDKNITVDYSIDGQMMGSTLTGNKDKLDVKIDVSEQEGEAIGTVDIITTGGKVVHTMNSSADTARFSLTLDNQYPYYFVRITQTDGDRILTAPIWTSDVQVKGITNLTPADGNEGIVGEEKKLNYTFKADGETVQSITVTDGKDVIGTAQGVADSITVTPKEEGKRTLTLTIKTDKDTYTKTVDLTVYPKSLKTTAIAEVHKAKEGEVFQIEGVLTSNASDHDKNTAFFDSAYIQDETGGINIFPISGDYKIGDKLVIRGVRSSYQGEGQLNITSMEKAGEGKAPAPKELKTGAVEDNLGLLVKTRGVVQSVKKKNDIVEAVTIDDGSGPIRIFIDGYIGRPGSDDKTMPEIKKGDTVEAIGLSSIDPEGNRIRVRNRDDVKVTQEGDPNPGIPDTPDEPSQPDKPNGGGHGHLIGPLIPVPGTTKPEEKPDKDPDHGKEDAPSAPKVSFTDVSKDDWFADVVEKIVEKGLMVGTSETTFAPGAKATRAMVVTMLYRLEGEPKMSQPSTFADVKADSWYGDAVAWAEANHITEGVSETSFAPDGKITREAFVTLMYRYLEQKGEIGHVTEPKKLEDTSDWAQASMTWATNNKIVLGREDGDLASKSPITRAEIAAIVLRTIDK
ncbi:MAG: CehA/McbA family metallohydrolase [Peptoniphilus sp.]|nr:CehA/McbA family metallohydrolase [Peptoniphilus sp.]MDD7362865.1 CehA/McbA family metallohydrolase [Bacillota bacterium]MDY6044894.1 CehA/McbA family metallohydrolase [Peptoniphilus sp.]